MRAAKVQASLRIRAVSPEPSLLAHTSSESRGTFRQKTRSLAPLNGWTCAVEICHDGMLEDTNSLGGAHLVMKQNKLEHGKTYQTACALSKDSSSLITVGCLHEEALIPWLPIECIAETLIYLCAGWSDSLLGAHHFVHLAMPQLKYRNVYGPSIKDSGCLHLQNTQINRIQYTQTIQIWRISHQSSKV